MYKSPNNPSAPVGNAAFVDQSYIDKGDWDVILGGVAGVRVLSGCLVKQAASADGTVLVDPGIVWLGGNPIVVASGVVAVVGGSSSGSGTGSPNTADTSQPRFDLITVDSAGVVARILGAPNAAPVYPTLAFDSNGVPTKVVLAHVYIPANQTTIDNSMITDHRVFGAYTPPPANYVKSGCVWSGTASLSAPSMTAGVVVIGGVPVAVAATTKTATTVKDTYVDVQADGVVRYTEVANNAASPALANSGTYLDTVRLGVIIAGASTITAYNQGSPVVTLPKDSNGQVYAVSDSLGNLIYPQKDQKLLAVRYRTADQAATATTSTDLLGMAAPFIAQGPGPLVRIKASLFVPIIGCTGTGCQVQSEIRTSGSIRMAAAYSRVSNTEHTQNVIAATEVVPGTPTTIKASFLHNVAGTVTVYGSTGVYHPMLMIEAV